MIIPRSGWFAIFFSCRLQKMHPIEFLQDVVGPRWPDNRSIVIAVIAQAAICMSQNVYSKIQTQNTYGFMLNRECTNDFFTNFKTTGQEFSIYIRRMFWRSVRSVCLCWSRMNQPRCRLANKLTCRDVVGRGRGGTASPTFFNRGTRSPLPHFLDWNSCHCCNWLLTETQCKIISV